VAALQLDAGDDPGNLSELGRSSGSQPRLEVQPLGDSRGNRNIRLQAVGFEQTTFSFEVLTTWL
jgi:Tfp pilus assembly protein PilX